MSITADSQGSYPMSHFFPFYKTFSRDNRGGIAAFPKLYHATRRQDTSWYAVDVIIHDADTVEFIVFEMLCNYRGGVGAEKYRYEAKIRDDDRQEMLDHMGYRAFRLGEQRLIEEEEAARRDKIEQYADEILATIR